MSKENVSVVVEDKETPVEQPADVSSEPTVEPTVEQVKVEEKTTPVTVQDRAVALPLSTVVRCSNLIENLSSRGCFRANELSEVGALYNVLSQVVNGAVNQIRAEQLLPKESTDTPSDVSAETNDV